MTQLRKLAAGPLTRNGKPPRETAITQQVTKPPHANDSKPTTGIELAKFAIEGFYRQDPLTKIVMFAILAGVVLFLITHPEIVATLLLWVFSGKGH